MLRIKTTGKVVNSGAILVIVLLMLALCGAITSQIASRVIRITGQAADAQKEAQSRWAAVSIRRTCLDLAPTILTEKIGEQSRPLRQRPFSLVLGSNRYEILLQDESAKLPIHKVLVRFPSESVKPTLRELGGGAGLLAVFPKKPTQMSEIFQRVVTSDTSASLRHWIATSDRMTLWTDGKINITVSDPQTLNALWKMRFNTDLPESILANRQLPTSIDLHDQNLKSSLTQTQAEFCAEWFSTQSNTHSVWIDSLNHAGSNFTAIYVRRRVSGFADEQFGFHLP